MDTLFWITLLMFVSSILNRVFYDQRIAAIKAGEYDNSIIPKIDGVLELLLTAYLFWTVGLKW